MQAIIFAAGRLLYSTAGYNGGDQSHPERVTKSSLCDRDDLGQANEDTDTIARTGTRRARVDLFHRFTDFAGE